MFLHALLLMKQHEVMISDINFSLFYCKFGYCKLQVSLGSFISRAWDLREKEEEEEKEECRVLRTD